MRKVFFLVVLQLFSIGSLQVSSGTHLEDTEDNSEDYLDELKRARPGFNNVDESKWLTCPYYCHLLFMFIFIILLLS